MSEPFVGQINMFAGNFAPRGWAFCSGQLLAISQNTALFSLLGTVYGGDGQTTFALPDLRGRVPIHPGTGVGLSPRSLGETGGAETVALAESQLPSHTHTATPKCNSGVANQQSPVGNVPAVEAAGVTATYSDQGYNADMATWLTDAAGGSQDHDNMPPFLAVNFIIALQGIYPSRD